MIDTTRFEKRCLEGIESYFDYRDVVSDNLLHCIELKKNEIRETWMEAFKDELWDWVNPNDNWYSREEDIKTICCDVDIDYDKLDEDDKDILRECFNENCYYKPDYDHFLNQDICVDIFIDSGDYNWDLGCNEVFPHYNGSTENEIQDECCLVWLSKTQGYSKEDLQRNLYENVENRFFETVYEELQNCSTHMNSLVFLKRMTLKEYLEILDNPDKSIHITKDTSCGLFDKWNGAGGLLAIQLDKDIDIDPSNIYKVIYDEGFKYNIHDVYGVTDKFWD